MPQNSTDDVQAGVPVPQNSTDDAQAGVPVPQNSTAGHTDSESGLTSSWSRDHYRKGLVSEAGWSEATKTKGTLLRVPLGLM